jgi:cytochrome b561
VQSIVKYALGWRILHWMIAALVMATIPIGLTMAARAGANIFDDVTNALYAVHKAIGISVLLLMLLRIAARYRNRVPSYPASLPRVQEIAARIMHYVLYALLVLTPLLGWAGVTAYPALTIAGVFRLPPFPLVPQSEALAETLFAVHGIVALTLAGLVLGHIAAAMRHLLVKKDGIFQRMWFGK